MKTVLEIEKAIEKRPESEQKKLAEWFGEHRFIQDGGKPID